MVLAKFYCHASTWEEAYSIINQEVIMFKKVVLGSWVLMAAVVIAACSSAPEAPDSMVSQGAKTRLSAVLNARSDELKARDASRNPAQVIEFFGVEPGMAVAEVLPGGGWYTQILAPYIGAEGAIYGLNYADSMWPMFGFFSEERIVERIASTNAFPEKVAAITDNGIAAQGFAFDNVPGELKGKLDAVLMIRALHNLNRFEEQEATRTKALQEVYGLLKVGGIVGVVQHRAAADSDDDWANGSSGYLKQAAVVAMFEQVGFELLASSEINANPKDQAGPGDIVWRLPPSLRVADDKKDAMLAVGESDRMTLKFIKK
jgi:predicted methyltransferase